MKVDIYRVIENQGTFGLSVVDGEVFGWTVEREWKNNEPFVSCVPPGKYKCKRVFSDKYGDTFEVQDVPGRDLIRMHWGSFPTDYQGCIGHGQRKTMFGTRHALKNTHVAFDNFMRRMDGIDEFELEIFEHAGKD